ncbi:hypothetical protein EYF80_053268 [Liparis tanakae]|uniref:Uncharacterized protein n=1 Tax=Liparis tanakae TaxID=230148 RepID=A0A4Z2F5X2_9TELE|nr:hypothetical protein EYF80_053268 [Liparis tanakae]
MNARRDGKALRVSSSLTERVRPQRGGRDDSRVQPQDDELNVNPELRDGAGRLSAAILVLEGILKLGTSRMVDNGLLDARSGCFSLSVFGGLGLFVFTPLCVRHSGLCAPRSPSAPTGELCGAKPEI